MGYSEAVVGPKARFLRIRRENKMLDASRRLIDNTLIINAHMEELRQHAIRNHEAYTFDDVLLRPNLSDVFPDQVDLTTRFTRNYNIPNVLVAAAMDTVMNARVGTALAKKGCVGVMHRGLPAEEQAEQVAQVRLASGFVPKPKVQSENSAVGNLLDRIEMRTHEGKNVFHTFPIVNEHGQVVGLVTGRDLRRYRNQRGRLLKEIMIPRKGLVIERPGLEAAEAYRILKDQDKSVLMLLDAAFMLHGMYLFDELQLAFEESNAGHSVDRENRLLIAAAIGVGEHELARGELLVSKGAKVLVIDTAHGHSMGVINQIKACKERFPDIDIVAGNIATDEAAEDLCIAGADALKVGIGPGSICTTRVVAGVGVPQLTAIMEVVHVARKFGVPVIGDGGAKNSGDINKGLGAGCDTYMVGGLLSGTDESPGGIEIDKLGRKVKQYRGMGSAGAMQDSSASLERYRQAKTAFVPEGVEGEVPYKGPIAGVVDELTGGVKSGLGYVGARNIAEMHTKARFRRMTGSGLRESHVHDVTVRSA